MRRRSVEDEQVAAEPPEAAPVAGHDRHAVRHGERGNLGVDNGWREAAHLTLGYEASPRGCGRSVEREDAALELRQHLLLPKQLQHCALSALRQPQEAARDLINGGGSEVERVQHLGRYPLARGPTLPLEEGRGDAGIEDVQSELRGWTVVDLVTILRRNLEPEVAHLLE